MAIKRYYATQDNTITNAYKANLTTRGVSGNMGQSDISEVFSIFAQASTDSSELARILTQFNTSEIATDRTDGKIPASGSVSFILRMYDARHPQTTPKDFTLVASAVSQSWQEGLGLDMENYSDEDESNWLYASDTKIAQVTTASLTANTKTNYDSKYISLYDTDKNRYNFWFSGSVAANAPSLDGTEIEVDISAGGLTTAADYATTLQGIVDAQSQFVATVDSADVGITNVTAGAVTAPTTNADYIDLTTTTSGSNYTQWITEGGDYYTDSSSSFSQSFDTGFENLEVDITTLVEQWVDSAGNILGSKTNYGVGIHLTNALETASDSYFTKKFFARGSQYYFKRPVIEARWDSSKQDDRGNFFLSSSLVPSSDNLMKLYLYNVVRGQLTDIPAVGTDKMEVSLYSGSTVPTGSKIGLSLGGGTVTAGDINTTASHVETGIYSCSFAYTSSGITNIFDVWHSGGIEYHTGSSVDIKTFDSEDYSFDQSYVSKIANLRTNYSIGETARFRLFVRNKNWSPTIYTVASTTITTSIVDNVYYKITRANDGLTVVDFGTGSLNHTRLSYDASGSYFDFDMSMLEAAYAYEINFVYLINGSYVEQPETFRFNVV